jgi:hypothetical protein
MHPMNPRPRLATSMLALLGWASLALQLGVDLARDHSKGLSLSHTLWHEAGYYTILTNLLTASALTLLALRRAGAVLSGAVTLYETLLGILNHFLLGGIVAKPLPQFTADLCLHYILPSLVLMHWILFAPKEGLRFMHAARWIFYPLGYGIYTLIRGSVTGKYPYFFLDAGRFGLPRIILNFLGLTVVFGLSGLVLVAVSHRLAGPRGSPTPL